MLSILSLVIARVSTLWLRWFVWWQCYSNLISVVGLFSLYIIILTFPLKCYSIGDQLLESRIKLNISEYFFLFWNIFGICVLSLFLCEEHYKFLLPKYDHNGPDIWHCNYSSCSCQSVMGFQKWCWITWVKRLHVMYYDFSLFLAVCHIMNFCIAGIYSALCIKYHIHGNWPCSWSSKRCRGSTCYWSFSKFKCF